MTYKGFKITVKKQYGYNCPSWRMYLKAINAGWSDVLPFDATNKKDALNFSKEWIDARTAQFGEGF